MNICTPFCTLPTLFARDDLAEPECVLTCPLFAREKDRKCVAKVDCAAIYINDSNSHCLETCSTI